MNADDISRRKAQGRRIRAEEEEYLFDVEQEERRQQMEMDKVKRGDERVTIVHRQADHERRIKRWRIVFERVPYGRPEIFAFEFTPIDYPWSIAERVCKAICGWKSEEELKQYRGMDLWVQPKLIKHEQVQPGVWEIDVQEGTND